jgi:DNA topoisomerase-1
MPECEFDTDLNGVYVPATHIMPTPRRPAGLTYSSDTEAGFRRRRTKNGFRYIDLDGKQIHDQDTIVRINSLVIPPAWEDVWICPTATGHIQATGRDAKGRKQYRYHPRWRAHREEVKFGALVAFGNALASIRAQVEIDLHRHNLPKEKVLATIIALLERTGIRVGNDEYAKSNKSYGLTTLQDRHVDPSGTAVRFKFKGKSGKEHNITLQDRRLAKIVKRCQDLPGQRLFVYEDDNGELRPIGSADVNAYLEAISGQHLTAKDFRTWAGTVRTAAILRHLPVPESDAELNRELLGAIDAVAELLGNTRAVARSSYIHPRVFDAFKSGELQAIDSDSVPDPEPGGLDADERVVLALLSR